MNSDFFDTAVEAGKRIFAQAGAKAGELTEQAKIRFRISELESELNRKYRKLGMLSCDLMDAGILTVSAEMQAVYNEIEAVRRALETLKEEL